jgi:site-specific DNA-methyltransferase (adenine-specific)
MARKPMKGSTVDNVLKHNVGALNIDATRIPSNDKPQANSKGTTKGFRKFMDKHQKGEAQDNSNDEGYIPNTEGRFPSNVIGEVEGYQKYFYCPKVSRKERHRGFEHIPDPISNYTLGDVKNHPLWDKSIGTNLQRLKHKIMEHNKDVGPKLDPLSHIPTDPGGIYDIDKGKYIGTKRQQANSVGNNHPTVKPVALMKYLIKLVAPQGSHIIDPFMGSGTTGMAAKELGITFTGIEMDKNYCDIAKRRIDASKADQFEKLFDDTIVNE